MGYKLYTIRNPSGQDEHQWAERTLDDELEICNQRSLATIFQRHLPKDGLILEAGCGLGGWVKWLKEHGYDAVGVDRYLNVVQRAGQLGVNVRQGEITALDFADNELAGYISLGVIEHFEEGPALAIKEAFRVLRPGGVAIFTTPAHTPVRTVVVHPMRTAAIAALRAMGRETYFGEYRFTLAELTNHIRAGGFQIVAAELDEIYPHDKARHIGLFADFPFFRDHSGAWRLNWAGRLALAAASSTLPPSAYVNGNCVIARKPL